MPDSSWGGGEWGTFPWGGGPEGGAAVKPGHGQQLERELLPNREEVPRYERGPSLWAAILASRRARALAGAQPTAYGLGRAQRLSGGLAP